MSLIKKEAVAKMVQSISVAENPIEPKAVHRLFECTLVLAEELLDYATEAAKERNSESIETCDIEMAINLIKQAFY